MKTITSRHFREDPGRSRYEMERRSNRDVWEPSPQQLKETERVIWGFIAVIFALILLFAYLFWNKI